MIVAEALAAGFKRHGIELIFSQCFPVRTQHVLPDYGIRQIGFRTENAGGAMADGFARISRHIAVVAGQSGPAATLLVPPLAECLTASVPVLAIIEESPRSQADRNAFQELDHLKLFEGCAKWIRRVDQPERLDDYLDMAITMATSGRPGPVVLIMPTDFLSEEARPAGRTASLGHYPLDRVVPEPALVAQAARLLAEAQRPLIVAGGGVHLSGGADELVALAELGAFPLATTNMGKGVIDETAALSVGVFGNTMEPGSRAAAARSLASDADVILFVGTRTNANMSDGWTLYPQEARTIHIDLDGLEIGRNYESLRLLGDARATIAAVRGALEDMDFTAPAGRHDAIAQISAQGRKERDAYVARLGGGWQGAVRPEAMVRALDAVIAPGDIVVTDASFATNWITAFLDGRGNGARIIEPRGLAGLGWGLPLAMGAKLARPDARVFALVGDGGFAHCWSELETARRMGIDVVVIVLNNQILGYQRHGEEWVFKQHSDAADLGPVDHAAIARACDCFGERVSSFDQFAGVLERAMNAGRPAVIDLMTDDTACPPISLFRGKEA